MVFQDYDNSGLGERAPAALAEIIESRRWLRSLKVHEWMWSEFTPSFSTDIPASRETFQSQANWDG